MARPKGCQAECTSKVEINSQFGTTRLATRQKEVLLPKPSTATCYRNWMERHVADKKSDSDEF